MLGAESGGTDAVEPAGTKSGAGHRRRPLTKAERDRVRELAHAGYKQAQISQETGLSKASVNRLLTALRESADPGSRMPSRPGAGGAG